MKTFVWCGRSLSSGPRHLDRVPVPRRAQRFPKRDETELHCPRRDCMAAPRASQSCWGPSAPNLPARPPPGRGAPRRRYQPADACPKPQATPQAGQGQHAGPEFTGRDEARTSAPPRRDDLDVRPRARLAAVVRALMDPGMGRLRPDNQSSLRARRRAATGRRGRRRRATAGQGPASGTRTARTGRSARAGPMRASRVVATARPAVNGRSCSSSRRAPPGTKRT